MDGQMGEWIRKVEGKKELWSQNGLFFFPGKFTIVSPWTYLADPI